MQQDRLLAQIAAAPNDAVPKWGYAEWLAEQQDARAELVRAMLCEESLESLAALANLPIDDTYPECLRNVAVLVQLKDQLWPHFAADCAERVLHRFEGLFPHDDRPRRGIAAARAYAAFQRFPTPGSDWEMDDSVIRNGHPTILASQHPANCAAWTASAAASCVYHAHILTEQMTATDLQKMLINWVIKSVQASLIAAKNSQLEKRWQVIRLIEYLHWGKAIDLWVG